MNELLTSYIEDLRDNLSVFMEAILQMEKGIRDEDTINAVFRVAHTIKGNSAAMEFTKIEEVMHKLEDILHEVREGNRELSPQIINVQYKCHDFLEDCLHILHSEASDDFIEAVELLAELVSIKGSSNVNKVTDSTEIEKQEIEKLELEMDVPTELWEVLEQNVRRGMHAYHIKLQFADDAKMKSVRAYMVFQKVEAYATLVCSEPERPTDEDFRNSKFVMQGEIMYLLVISDKEIEELISELEAEPEIDEVECLPLGLGNIAAYMQTNENADDSKNSEESSDTQNKPKASPSIDKKSASNGSGLIRVEVGKVDNLIDMLGELLILNAQMEQQVEADESANTGLLNTLTRVAKIIRSVQDLSMSLKLIKIKNTLLRLTRIIRDTASDLGKQVSVNIIGEDTEIDRSAADKLFEPLMHLVRNAVSHGIETPEEREQSGKDSSGTIDIKAYSKRGYVYVEVNDDGRGIDTGKVLKKAVKLGMADESTEYSEAEIVNFILQPGFSTQSQVNNISGRGVGMNVVESEIKKMGGKLEIINNMGKGCSFILRIPMNLALINGTIVDICGSHYIIPTLFIKHFLIQEQKDWISIQGEKRAVMLREKVIPIITDEQIFGGFDDSGSEKRHVIILEMEHKMLALPVNNIIGRKEIVAKPLDKEYLSSGIISGAAILGDGKVSLILDVEALFKMAEQTGKKTIEAINE